MPNMNSIAAVPIAVLATVYSPIPRSPRCRGTIEIETKETAQLRIWPPR